MCLVRFALANIRRRPERFVLSVLGIALAIACVTRRAHHLVEFRHHRRRFGDRRARRSPTVGGARRGRALRPRRAGVGRRRPRARTSPLPAGWTRHPHAVRASPTINGTSVSLRGSDEIPTGQATLGSALAERLGVHAGRPRRGRRAEPDRRHDGQRPVRHRVHRARAVGRRRATAGGPSSRHPARRRTATSGQTFGAAVGLPSTSDPVGHAGRRRARA